MPCLLTFYFIRHIKPIGPAFACSCNIIDDSLSDAAFVLVICWSVSGHQDTVGWIVLVGALFLAQQ